MSRCPNHVLVMLMIKFFERVQKEDDDQCTQVYCTFSQLSARENRFDRNDKKRTKHAWNAYMRITNEINESDVAYTLDALREILKS